MKFLFTFYNRFVGIHFSLTLDSVGESEQLQEAWTKIYMSCQEQHPVMGEYKDWFISSVRRCDDRAHYLVPVHLGKGHLS